MFIILELENINISNCRDYGIYALYYLQTGGKVTDTDSNYDYIAAK